MPASLDRLRHVLGDPDELAALARVERAVDRVGVQAGEPGFEPGFMVLETMRITINSLPWASRDGTDPAGLPSEPYTNICSYMAYDITIYEARRGASRNRTQRLQDRRRNRRQTINRPDWRLAAASPAAVKRAELAAAWSVHGRPARTAICSELSRRRNGSCAEAALRLYIVNDRRLPRHLERDPAALWLTRFRGRPPRVHPSSTGESDVLCICHPGDRPSVSSARAWAEAPPPDRSDRVAARAHPRASRIPAARAHPLRRLPGRQSLQNEAPERPRRRVRLHPLLLQQPLGRHPADLS